MLLPMLEKPARGKPCNGCGVCCLVEVCGLGLEVLGGKPTQAPCPFVRTHDGRMWCGVIEEATKEDIAFGAHLSWRLGIGSGCDCE